MKSIIEREATFENNSDMEVKVTQKKISRAFVNETQWSKTCSTVKSTWKAKHRGRGKRNMLITFTLDSIEFQVYNAVTLAALWKYDLVYFILSWAIITYIKSVYRNFDDTVAIYEYLTYMYCHKIIIIDVVKCWHTKLKYYLFI